MKIDILGVLIDNDDMPSVISKVDFLLSDKKKHYIVTPNPEFVVLAQKDNEFSNILNSSDISIPDGIGIIIAARFLSKKVVQRITGVELMLEICKLAEQKMYSIFLLGGEVGVAQKASEKLKERHPHLEIRGILDGEEIDHMKDVVGIIETINNSKADIVFVALGQGKQEKFIYYNLEKLYYIKLAMGVGGAFDFLSGKRKRAPQWMQKCGLEWMFRLIQEPWRWKRILNAVIFFPILVIKKKYFSHKS